MIGIRRGTTPSHAFRIGIDTETLDKIEITYAQRGDVKITKTEDDAVISENRIAVSLTQEETFRLSCDVPVSIHVRVKRSDGYVPDTEPIHVPVLPCQSDTVL